MPYKDPERKKKYDAERHVRLGDQRRAAAREYASTHKEQKRKYDKARREELGEELRAYDRERHPHRYNRQDSYHRHLKRKYGLTPEKYAALLAEQQGLCALCAGPLGDGKVVVDHDHDTDKVRGILHHRCNVGLPYVEDEAFRSLAISYLKRHTDV